MRQVNVWQYEVVAKEVDPLYAVCCGCDRQIEVGERMYYQEDDPDIERFCKQCFAANIGDWLEGSYVSLITPMQV